MIGKGTVDKRLVIEAFSVYQSWKKFDWKRLSAKFYLDLRFGLLFVPRTWDCWKTCADNAQDVGCYLKLNLLASTLRQKGRADSFIYRLMLSLWRRVWAGFVVRWRKVVAGGMS